MFYFKSLLFFFISITYTIYGQKEYSLKGILSLRAKNKMEVKYQIVFSENNGKIEGYSICDIGDVDETKIKIIGTYNYQTNELNYRETDVIHTKSIFNENNFCFVQFIGKINLNLPKLKLEGEFKAFYNDNQSCNEGTVLLTGNQQIKKYDNNLTANKNLNIFWNANKFILEIWDKGRLDGDTINLYKDGNLILENYTVTLNKKRIIIDSKNNFELKIEALSEGTFPPNTAQLALVEKNKKIELFSDLKKGETSSITILKELSN